MLTTDSLKLEFQAQQESPRLIELRGEHAKICRAVQTQRWRGEVHEVEYVEHLGGEDQVITLGDREILP